MNGDWTQGLRRPQGTWILLVFIVGLVLSGCSTHRDDRRALTDAEIQAEMVKYSGTLLATTTMDTRSVLFLDSPTGKRCHVSQIRDTGAAFGQNLVLATVSITQPITILNTWDTVQPDEREVFCIAINDLALQRDVTRVQLVLPDGTTTDVNIAGQKNFIFSISSNTYIVSYTLRFYDASNTLRHTEVR